MADEGQAPPPPTRYTPKVNPPPPLNTKKGAAEWKLFKQMWINYTIVARIGDDNQDYIKALFLHTIGPDALSIYNGMNLDDASTLNDIISAFDEHFIGQTNETYERYVFNKRDQKEGEQFEEYLSALRTLRKTCNFCEHMKDSLLRDRLILGIKDNDTRQRLLQESNLTLTQCIDRCRAAESAEKQLEDMKLEKKACALKSKVKEKNLKPHDESPQPRNPYNKYKMLKSCNFCGQSHIWNKEKCPAWGKRCTKCRRQNHFAEKCQLVDDSETDDDSEDEQLYSINSDPSSSKSIKVKMIIENKEIR